MFLTKIRAEELKPISRMERSQPNIEKEPLWARTGRAYPLSSMTTFSIHEPPFPNGWFGQTRSKMDFERLQHLAEEIMSGLGDAPIGELVFMHHVIINTIQLLKDVDEPEILQICDTLEQALFNEISRRVHDGRIAFHDPDALQLQIAEFYTRSSSDSELARTLKEDLLDEYMRRAKRKKNGMEKENREFLKRYRKAFGIKNKYKVPSPNEIINGKSPPDIPNN